MVVHLSEEIGKFVKKQATEKGYRSVDEFVEDVLREQEKLQEETTTNPESQVWLKQQNAILRLRIELENLPPPNPGVGFTNRDHDRLIYEDDK